VSDHVDIGHAGIDIGDIVIVGTIGALDDGVGLGMSLERDREDDPARWAARWKRIRVVLGVLVIALVVSGLLFVSRPQ
jgi:hypothetical protein